MEFGNNNNCDDIEMWDWQDGEFPLQKNLAVDASLCLWDNMIPTDNSLLYTLGEHTPAKDCGDFGYDSNLGDKNNEMVEELRESSHKRRRMLQFTDDNNEQIISSASETNEQSQIISSVSEISKEFEASLLADEMLDCLDWNSKWNSSFSDDRSSGGWPTNCSSETDMIRSSGEMSFSVNDSVSSEEQAKFLESVGIPSEPGKVTVRKKPSSSLCRIFRGRKSFMNTPTKLTTTVAYPFTLIKPCEDQGDVTLNYINQRIRPAKSKPDKGEDPSLSYPRSAISGKPVVAKTKIRTEGGKGSITITRTKG